jgi:hypothetical protein
VRATAHKLARLIYTLMTKGAAYVDQGQDYYEEQHQQRVMKNLKQKGVRHGIFTDTRRGNGCMKSSFEIMHLNFVS